MVDSSCVLLGVGMGSKSIDEVYKYAEANSEAKGDVRVD